MTALDDVRQALAALADAQQQAVLRRFFKTGPGGYAEHDVFIGIKVPQLRALAKHYRHLDLAEALVLLRDPIHEYRQLALVLMQELYRAGDEGLRAAVFQGYLKHTAHINNWDLVDVSAPHIVGAYLLERPREVLYRLAEAEWMWERRIAIVATLAFIRRGQFDDTLRLAEKLLGDSHDLMHKACGWMLREVGKRDQARLEAFLDDHRQVMPRTMLRYSIEKFSPERRRAYLAR